MKKETIKKLEEIKENLKNQNEEENYCNIINILIDYDNEMQDELYLYDNFRDMINTVDEDTIQYYLEYQFEKFGLERVPYIFENVNYGSNIYKINDFENLENLKNDELKYAIDEIIKKILESDSE